MSCIDDLVAEIQHALQRPTEVERETALRVVKERAQQRLYQLEQLAKEEGIRQINEMIIDCISIPGCQSDFQASSHQDVLVALRGRVSASLGLQGPAFASKAIEERIKAQVKNLQVSTQPRHLHGAGRSKRNP
jgi:methionyl-tRNA formyltransferase